MRVKDELRFGNVFGALVSIGQVLDELHDGGVAESKAFWSADGNDLPFDWIDVVYFVADNDLPNESRATQQAVADSLTMGWPGSSAEVTWNRGFWPPSMISQVYLVRSPIVVVLLCSLTLLKPIG